MFLFGNMNYMEFYGISPETSMSILAIIRSTVLLSLKARLGKGEGFETTLCPHCCLVDKRVNMK